MEGKPQNEKIEPTFDVQTERKALSDTESTPDQESINEAIDTELASLAETQGSLAESEAEFENMSASLLPEQVTALYRDIMEKYEAAQRELKELVIPLGLTGSISLSFLGMISENPSVINAGIAVGLVGTPLITAILNTRNSLNKKKELSHLFSQS